MSPISFKLETYPSILYDILSKLRPADYRRAAKVCRAWREISQLDSLIKKMYCRCFHATPHPDIIKERGWKLIVQLKQDQLRNVREGEYHLFFYADSAYPDDSRITRFEVCGNMNVLERESGRNFVVNHLGKIVHEYTGRQCIYDSFDNLIAGMICEKPELLVIYDSDLRRGNYYFLPDKWKFCTQLKGKFLSKNSLLAYVTRETDFYEHEIKLCLLRWDKNPEIKMEELYTRKGNHLTPLINKHRGQLHIVMWRYVYFNVGKEMYSIDLKNTKPAAIKIYEHENTISEFGYWNRRVYMISAGKVSVLNVVTRKVEMTIAPKFFDKVWLRENYLFEYLPTTKHIVVTNLEKGAIVGKWSVALPHTPSKMIYTVTAIDYMRDTFFCLYSGAASVRTIRSFDMRSSQTVDLDNMIYLGTQFGCYQRMKAKDGRLFVMLDGGEGVIIDYNKTPRALEDTVPGKS